MEIHYKATVWISVRCDDKKAARLIEKKLNQGCTVEGLYRFPEIAEHIFQSYKALMLKQRQETLDLWVKFEEEIKNSKRV